MTSNIYNGTHCFHSPLPLGKCCEHSADQSKFLTYNSQNFRTEIDTHGHVGLRRTVKVDAPQTLHEYKSRAPSASNHKHSIQSSLALELDRPISTSTLWSRQLIHSYRHGIFPSSGQLCGGDPGVLGNRISPQSCGGRHNHLVWCWRT